MPGRHDAGRIPPGTASGRALEAAAWPNGPTRADGRPPPAAMPFSLTLPASPPGTGGGQNTKPAAQRPTTFSSGPRAPPVDVRGRSGPDRRAEPGGTRPGWPGQPTADLAAGMTAREPVGPGVLARGPAGRLLERADAGMERARGSPRAVAVQISDVDPRQRL